MKDDALLKSRLSLEKAQTSMCKIDLMVHTCFPSVSK